MYVEYVISKHSQKSVSLCHVGHNILWKTSRVPVQSKLEQITCRRAAWHNMFLPHTAHLTCEEHAPSEQALTFTGMAPTTLYKRWGPVLAELSRPRACFSRDASWPQMRRSRSVGWSVGRSADSNPGLVCCLDNQGLYSICCGQTRQSRRPKTIPMH